MVKTDETSEAYDNWFNEVRTALNSINMPMDDWQKRWSFNFTAEYKAGTKPGDAAAKANRFWWHLSLKTV
jgi:hypothetical protein